AWDEALAKAEAEVALEHDEVTESGGLYVLGTERHESRRIDNQLRGRSGRQGDPGESRFYLSLEDHLMRLFNAGLVDRVMTTAKLDDDQPIESKLVSRSIQSAQAQVEAQNFEIRKNVLKYDDVLNRQRTVIYDERRRVLEGEDLHEQLRLFVNDVIDGYVDAETAEGFPEDWNLERLWQALKALYPVSLTADQLEEAAGGRSGLSSERLKEELLSDAHHAYDAREERLGSEVMREVERRVMLSVLDRKWREHLYEMDYLQEGIGLRAMAQRDPLVEYQREGFQLWSAMNEAVKEESVQLVFHVDVKVDEPQQQAPAPAPVHVSQMLGAMAGSARTTAEEPIASDTEVEAAPVGGGTGAFGHGAAGPRVEVSGVGVGRPRHGALRYSAPTETGEVEQRDGDSPQRGSGLTDEQLASTPKNAPCPCGSGKKFKMCHGRR
ncbi:MAG: SEC-C metal-binding domain-containing protein, partial [Phycicoccus sp.]